VAPHIVSLGGADQYHVTWEATVLRLFVEQEARHFVFFSVSFLKHGLYKDYFLTF
jgi:hypothetical protein